MNNPLTMTEQQLRFRLGYDLLPALDGSAPAKKKLGILIAWPSLTERDAAALAVIPYANWYCDDVADQVDLSIALHVPENASEIRAVFDALGVDHEIVLPVDESNLEAVSELALALDCDLVLSPESEALARIFSDEVGLVSADFGSAMHAVEIHMRGFDLPWSFEAGLKNMPWSNFYLLGERSTFEHLLTEHGASRAAGDDVYDVMRSLVYDALPALCRSRDRLEFYRQQDRWAQRQQLKRQNFAVEYAIYLNHFYLTYYAAVDQITALVVHRYKMPVPERHIGATYRAFRIARKAVRAVDRAFSNKAFREMYRLPTLIRHHAAHRGPVKPADVYFSDGEFTNEQIEEAMGKHGLLESVQFFEQLGEVPQVIIDQALLLAREEARRILMGPPRRHGVFLKDGKKALFYYPDPAADLSRLLTFFDRVLTIVKPWDEPTPAAAGAPGKGTT